MATNTVTGSVTIKRLRTGATLTISFNTHSKQLMQVLSEGQPVPNWETNADSRVTITPIVQCITSDESVAIESLTEQWHYQGLPITFSSTANSDGNYISTNFNGSFMLVPATSAQLAAGTGSSLVPVKNLISETNLTNDEITYSCMASYNGVQFSLSKSIYVIMMLGGTSAYLGTITASDNLVNLDQPNQTLQALLSRNGEAITDFFVAWYRTGIDSDLLINPNYSTSNKGLPWFHGSTNGWEDGKTTTSGYTKVTVTTDDVHSLTLFIAVFYLDDPYNADGTINGSVEPVTAAAIQIIDSSDTLTLDFVYDSNVDTASVRDDVAVMPKIYDIENAKYIPLAHESANVGVKRSTNETWLIYLLGADYASDTSYILNSYTAGDYPTWYIRKYTYNSSKSGNEKRIMLTPDGVETSMSDSLILTRNGSTPTNSNFSDSGPWAIIKDSDYTYTVSNEDGSTTTKTRTGVIVSAEVQFDLILQA